MCPDVEQTQPVLACYNKPRLSPNLQTRYAADGLLVVDYGTGWSMRSEDVDDPDERSAAGNAFNRLRELSQYGGIGAIRSPNDDDELITVGRWYPNCVTFREEGGIELKGVQMGEYGIFAPDDPLYKELDVIFNQGGSAVLPVPKHKATLENAFSQLEVEGRLRRPL